jgi:hypothetical protein
MHVAAAEFQIGSMRAREGSEERRGREGG